MDACLPTAGNYPLGSSDTPRTLGNKFKSPSDTDLDDHQISKRQKNTDSSSDSKLLETQSEKLDVDPTTVDFDDLFQSERAEKIREQEDLFQAKKLSLVLDLDHTLLHSVRFDEIDSMHYEMLIKKQEIDEQKQQRYLFCPPRMEILTKLRPGIWDFLEQASKLYELHICTKGGELYAMEMAELLDPTGKYFGGRIVSKLGKRIKDLDEVLGMESTAIIIDDTDRVWPNHLMNLIKVGRYMYFPSKKSQFDLPKSSLFERRRDERPVGGVLASVMEMIKRVHQIFYSNPRTSLGELDVRFILEEEKHKVLAGCHLLFVKVSPVDGDTQEQESTWKDAQQLGAVCTTEMNSIVTYVVSEKSRSPMVNWARATGRFVLSSSWIAASKILYHKANENDFSVE